MRATAARRMPSRRGARPWAASHDPAAEAEIGPEQRLEPVSTPAVILERIVVEERRVAEIGKRAGRDREAISVTNGARKEILQRASNVPPPIGIDAAKGSLARTSSPRDGHPSGAPEHRRCHRWQRRFPPPPCEPRGRCYVPRRSTKEYPYENTITLHVHSFRLRQRVLRRRAGILGDRS